MGRSYEIDLSSSLVSPWYMSFIMSQIIKLSMFAGFFVYQEVSLLVFSIWMWRNHLDSWVWIRVFLSDLEVQLLLVQVDAVFSRISVNFFISLLDWSWFHHFMLSACSWWVSLDFSIKFNWRAEVITNLGNFGSTFVIINFNIWSLCKLLACIKVQSV